MDRLGTCLARAVCDRRETAAAGQADADTGTRGECGRTCSFFSGEGATAFWTYAPAALTPPVWRPLAYVAATLFGAVTSGLRMAFGGHFFTDVAISGLVSFFVIWLAYALIYRWPSTRLTNAQVEATLARWGQPGYRLWRRWTGRTAE